MALYAASHHDKHLPYIIIIIVFIIVIVIDIVTVIAIIMIIVIVIIIVTVISVIIRYFKSFFNGTLPTESKGKGCECYSGKFSLFICSYHLFQ